MNGQPFTDVQLSEIRRRYPHERTDKIAADIGRPLQSVYRKAALLGLRKTRKYLDSPDACRLRRGGDIGAAYRFKPGQAPANKGLRRPGWFAGRMRETQFKKGQRAHNRQPIGSIKVVDGYQYTKVRNARYIWDAWKPTHHQLWKKAGRKIPRGHVLTFKDGDRTHIKLANLKLETRGEMARRNHWKRTLPPELQKCLTLKIAIKRRITMRERNEQNNRRPAGPPVRAARTAQGKHQRRRGRTRKGGVRSLGADHRLGKGRSRVPEHRGRKGHGLPA